MIRKLKTLSVIDAMLVTSTVFAGLGLATNFSVAATTTSVPATVRISSACSLGKTIDTPHEVTLSNGNYSGASGYGQTTLKAFCNDAGGFSIYAIGYTSDEYGNTTMHWNKAASSSDNTNAIPTEVYDAGNMSNSSWSMKLSAVSGTYAATIDDGNSSHNNSTEDFTSWHEIPEQYTRVAYRLSGTDTEQNGSGVGSSITVTYDTYITPTQPAGTYVGQVKFTLVHPSTEVAPMTPIDPSVMTANYIIYAPNANDVEGDMSSIGTTTELTNISPKAGRQNVSDSTVTLIAPNFKREGYGFAGWSTDFEATSASTIYGPNETINIGTNEDEVDISNGLILYPVWVESSGSLQGWTGCSSLYAATYNSTTGKVSSSLDDIIALTDTRDGNVYAVAKLTDGNCWMIENLRLDAEHSRGASNITKSQGYGTSTTYGNFIGLADSEDTNMDGENPTSANNNTNGIYSSDGSTTINIGTAYPPGYRTPRYNGNNTNMGGKNSNNADLVASHTANTDTAQWYSYGNYYAWPAAIASTILYSTYSGSAGTDAANTSICPSGWHLPKGAVSTGVLSDGANDVANRVGSFSYLDRTMGGTGDEQYSYTVPTGATQSGKWRSFPNNIVYSGLWIDSLPEARRGGGSYWSASADNTYGSYNFYINSATISPGTYVNPKYQARTIRCLTD